MLRAERSRPHGEGPGHAGELAGPVHLGAQPGAGRAVRQVNLHLGDAQSLAEQVDGQAGLHPPARGERAGGLEGRAGQAALPVQRLRRARERGGELEIAAPKPAVRKILQVTGLDSVFTLIEDTDPRGLSRPKPAVPQ